MQNIGTRTTSPSENAIQIITEMEQTLAILKSDFENEQLKIIKILDPFVVQESRYQRRIEPLQEEQQIILDAIKACKESNTEMLDIENLKAQYIELSKKMRDIFINGRREYFKSRGQYYDKESEKYIILDKEGLKLVMDKFIEELDIDLTKHYREFVITLQKIKSLTDLVEHEKQLSINIGELSTTYGTIVEVKTPYMSDYLDNEIVYIAKKQFILYQTFLKIVNEKASPTDCEIFIETYKFDVNFQDKDGFCLLHRMSDPNIIQVLLKHGANTELTLNYIKPYDHRGFTPLHWHVSECNIEIVSLLLEKGANPDARSKLETTPLFLATKILPKILKDKGLDESKARKLIDKFIELLMKHGANVRARNVSAQNGDRHFAMGCPHGHKWDKFEETAYFTEELFGEQASKGMQAWHKVQKQEMRIQNINKEQAKMQESIDALKKDNEQLKKKIDILMKQLNLEQPEENAMPEPQKIQEGEDLPVKIGAQLSAGFFSMKSAVVTANLKKQQNISSLSAMLGENDNAEKFLAEDIIINKTEIVFSICDNDNFYTADFINLLLHPYNQDSNGVIKAYPGIQVEQLIELLEKIQNQTAVFAFIPLNVAYDDKNPKHKNHWAALIIDKKQQLIMYFDPAKNTKPHEQIEALRTKLNYKKDILENPINFQKNEQNEHWIRHCGVYAVSLFKAFANYVQESKCISGYQVADPLVSNSMSAETAFSSIPCGEADNVDRIREEHIEQAQIILTNATRDNAYSPKSGH